MIIEDRDRNKRKMSNFVLILVITTVIMLVATTEASAASTVDHKMSRNTHQSGKLVI
jgi:hypothetical protein